MNDAQTFATNIKLEHDQFQQFVGILQTEQEALSAGDIDRLTALAELKVQKVIILSELADKRAQYLKTQGLNVDLEGVEQCLQHMPPTTQAIWQKLLDFARTAQQLNETNGAMIENGLRNNQQALSTLYAAANQTNLYYGRDGQKQSLGNGRILGKV